MSDLKPVTMYCCKGCQHLHHEIVTACDCGTGCEPFEYELWEARRTQPEATAPAQDLSAAILARQIIQDTNDTLREQSEGLRQLKAENDQLRALLASPANALSAGDSQKALDALLTRIDDAFEAYERYGGICEFEGNPMIYADTLTEIVTLRGEYHAILQSQKAK